MTTKTLKQSPPPVKSAVDPGAVWRDRVVTSHRQYTKPGEALVPPPSGVSVDDLVCARNAIDADVVPGMLLSSLLRSIGGMPVLFAGQNGAASDVSIIRPDLTAADRLAGRIASESGREIVSELAQGFLDLLDTEITARLDQDHGSDRLIRSRDFASLTAIYSAELDLHLVAGMVHSLPENHILRQWSGDVYVDVGNGPAVILGRQNQHQSHRPFYYLDSAADLTRQLRLHQLRRRLEAARLTVADFTVAKNALSAVENNRPAPRQQRPVPASTVVVPWAKGVQDALTVLQRPSSWLTPPPRGTAIDDLLAVREAFGVDDGAESPARDAAQRLAAKCAGQVRRDELIEILRPLLAKVNEGLMQSLESGLLSAARSARR